MSKFLLVPEMMDLLRIKRTTLYAEIKRGTIPKPLKLSAGKSAWHIDDVKKLIEQRRMAANGQ
ncbi:AlpA family transcriptional regulator [Lelliottia sp. RWM.1]|uniref:helix-turn-helix transcriptional regulator n=1 Tax=Lelliottia sp. RWM.1 TaxID=2663242 RepID=UPI00193D7AD5|nr:AlpA family phage regulatory protein [Lelliottia sp. RWM.1]MBM3071662.1 AlpA family phage regulatory protein [Lelliottia sp. RWM.1]